MTLLTQCPICRQSLVYKGRSPERRLRCPSCEAPLRLRRPNLAEHEILSILSAPAAKT